jgi:predicted metal-dependent hydrolase
MANTPRYCPARDLPPYSYVPGLAPHPMSDPRGHSFGVEEPVAQPLDESSYTTNESYLFAIDLFNHGYYWEAHEEWEQLWHLAGRTGPTADLLKGLIKLAAAGVKLREGRMIGVKQHGNRSSELLQHAATVNGQARDTMFGLQLAEICSFATGMAANAGQFVENGKPNTERTLHFVLQLNKP